MTDPRGISRRQALKYGGVAAAVPLLPAVSRGASMPLLAAKHRHASKPLLLFQPQQQVPPPVASAYGPSLAVFNGLLYMAWHGSPGDNRLWWSSFDGHSWAGQQQVPSPVRSTDKPALAVFNGLLYMAWHGYGDNGLWWTTAS